MQIHGQQRLTRTHKNHTRSSRARQAIWEMTHSDCHKKKSCESEARSPKQQCCVHSSHTLPTPERALLSSTRREVDEKDSSARPGGGGGTRPTPTSSWRHRFGPNKNASNPVALLQARISTARGGRSTPEGEGGGGGGGNHLSDSVRSLPQRIQLEREPVDSKTHIRDDMMKSNSSGLGAKIQLCSLRHLRRTTASHPSCTHANFALPSSNVDPHGAAILPNFEVASKHAASNNQTLKRGGVRP